MKFGTSGLRGLASDLAGPATSRHVEAFFAHLRDLGLAAPGSTVFLARDHRESSPDILMRCAAALERCGLQPIDCGTIPTPALALHAMANGSASLMVTGSHIPEDRNGIKFYLPSGEITKADEQAITMHALRLEDGYVPPPDITMVPDDAGEAADRFDARSRGLVEPGSLDGWRIGVYDHSTVAAASLTDMLRHAGAVVVSLGASERFIAVDTEAVSDVTHQHLQAWAQEHDLQAIVSADGDGDRPLVADERGTPVPGDLLGLLAARHCGAHTIVTPVTSNSGIRSQDGIMVRRTRVGSPFVLEAMAETPEGEGPVVGFEANGGVLLGSKADTPAGTLDALPTRDCLLPVASALTWAVTHDRPISELLPAHDFPLTAADRLQNVDLQDAAAFVDAVARDAETVLQELGDVVKIDQTDGSRATFADGSIVHFRPSGNAPELRCYVEAADSDSASTLLKRALDLAAQHTTPAA